MTAKSLTLRSESGNNRSKEIDKYGKISFSVAQKMIYKFLNYDRLEKREEIRTKYTKRDLAKKLNISVEELEKFKALYVYKNMEDKISWDLASLYCSTKWVERKKETNKEEKYGTTNRFR